MLGSLVLVSHMECFLLYDASFQLERYDLRVPQLPHLAATIPLPARLLYLVPLLHCMKLHTGKCPPTPLVPVPRGSRGPLFRGVAEDGTVGSRCATRKPTSATYEGASHAIRQHTRCEPVLRGVRQR